MIVEDVFQQIDKNQDNVIDKNEYVLKFLENKRDLEEQKQSMMI